MCGPRRISSCVWLFALATTAQALNGAIVTARAQAPQQQPVPPLSPYRVPVIALVQPASGGTVPQDRPVVVFRFAPGEADDPLDVSSFRVAVDGSDETTRFQVGATEAWGPIGAPIAAGNTGGDGAIANGAHQVLAQVCSSRGTCAEASALITVVPSAAAATASGETKAGSRRARVIDALLSAVKKILSP